MRNEEFSKTDNDRARDYYKYYLNYDIELEYIPRLTIVKFSYSKLHEIGIKICR